MRIRVWGTRGSIPVSGPEYMRYGGDTTCFEVTAADGEVLIVDAGTGIRGLGNRLAREGDPAVNLLFTHAHWDHLLGFPFFKPLYDPSARIALYGCLCSQSSVREMISGTMNPPNFPVSLKDTHAEVIFHDYPLEDFQLGSVTVTPVVLSHTNTGIGYRFTENGRRVVILTDNELRYQHPGGGTFDDYVALCRGADLLVHDAQFLPDEYGRRRRWGHSTNVDAVDLAVQAGVKALGLCHHDQDRTDPEVDEIVAASRHLLKRERAEIECFGIAQGLEREV